MQHKGTALDLAGVLQVMASTGQCSFKLVPNRSIFMYIRRIAIFDMSLDNEGLSIPVTCIPTGNQVLLGNEVYIAVIERPDWYIEYIPLN